MTGDNRLKTLAGIGRTQAPRDAARDAALHAAMDAFDAAGAPVQGKISAATQGSKGQNRLISIATHAWRTLMNPKTLAGPVAAAIGTAAACGHRRLGRVVVAEDRHERNLVKKVSLPPL